MNPLALGAVMAMAAHELAGRPAVRRRPNGVSAPARTLRLDPGAVRHLLERARPARRRALLEAQLPAALDRFSAALRAGQSLRQALTEVAATLSDPLGSDLRRVAAEVSHGAAVPVALATWTGRHGSSADVRLVAAALSLGATGGGEVAQAVDRVARTLRDREELRGEVRALATQARASAIVLVIAPLGFTVLVATVEPASLGFLCTTPLGLACLGAGVGLDALGARWMARIIASAR